MPVAPRARQVLANLRVAVDHSGHLRVVEVCGGKFFPTTCGRKAVQSDQGRTVHNDVADLDHSFQSYDLGLVDFIASKQFGVVAEIAQEPVELPEGLRVAIEPARNEVPSKPAGLKNGQSQGVIGLPFLSIKPDSLHLNQEDSIRDLVSGTAIGG